MYRPFFFLMLFGLFTLYPATIEAQITGQIFRDFNANGTKEANEIGEPGITVRAYNSAGTEVSGSPATTNTSGNYSISGGTGTLRVEFHLPAWYYASKGQTSNTTIQFVSASGTANLGINAPNDYYSNSNANPPLISTRQKNGDPLAGGTAATGGSIMSIPYNQGCGVATSGGGSATEPTILASPAQTGSIWGVCHQRATNTLFTSAFLRRHMGLGPGKDGNGQYASGAIYKTDLPSGTPSYFFSLDELGFPTQASGTYSNTPFTPTNLVIGTNAQRGLTSSSTSPNTDAAAYHQVGRVSIGDIDLSEDEKTMFIMNLYDKKLYKVFIDNPSVAPDAADVNSYTVPAPSCTSGRHYPWAIKAWRGQVYVGIVCSAEDDASALDDSAPAHATRAKLFAYVYKFDTSTNTFNTTPVITLPLNYMKGCAYGDTCPPGDDDHWGNWADRNTTTREYAEPILADIEFDIDGDMILGLMDRAGAKKGYRNADPDDGSSPGTSESKYLSGDMLRANYDYLTGSWTLENNGNVGGVTTTGAGNNQGIGGGEFYVGDSKGNESCGQSTGSHMEVYMGGLALMAGKGEVAFTAMDPAQSHGSGILILNNTTGLTGVTRYQFETQGSGTVEYFGKAGGLGDIELIGDPAPIEIGNRVWLDTDNDGVQDAGEAGISGVQVQLLKGATVLATATTDPNGNYYFSSGTGTDTASIKYGLTQLMPNMAYTVRFPTTTTVTGTTYNLTTANAGTNNLIDSDAAVTGDISVLATDIPVSGANNHTFDVGYSATACAISAAALQNVSCYPGGTLSNGTDDQIYFSLNPTGTGLGSNYVVSVSGGGTVMPATAVNYGSERWFILNAGSAGSGNKTLTITDGTTGTCTLNVPLTDPGSCTSTCTGNLLVNPSFETDALNTTPPTGWSGTGVVGGNNMNEPEGTKYGYDNDGPSGILYQDVSAVTGDTFTMKFYAGSHAPGSQTVSIRYLDSSGATLGTTSTYNIAFDTDVFTPQILGGPYMLTLASAPIGTASVRVEANNGGLDFAKVDAFCLEKTSLPVCSINTPTIATTCNDNGTPAITTDDTFTFTISATGTGVGANYKVDKTAPAPTSTPFASVNYGTTSASSAAFPISGGNLTLTLTDNTTATCTLTNINVPAPAPCSTPPAGQPDLELVKTADKATVVSGNTLTYTLTLRNTGTVAATGVQIRDLLPAGLTYVSSVPSQGTYTVGTGIWNVGTVVTGATLTLTITVTVN